MTKFCIPAISTQRFGAAFLLVVFSQALALVQPYLLKLITDYLNAGRAWHDLVWVVGVGAGAALLQAGLGFGVRRLLSDATERWHYDLRKHLVEVGLAAKLESLRGSHIGHVATLIEYDSREITSLYGTILPGVIGLVCTLVGTGIILLVIAPMLSLMVLIPLPIIAGLAVFFDRTVRVKNNELRNRKSAVASILFESFSGIESVKIYGAEDEIAARIDHHAEVYRDTAISLGHHSALLYPALNLVMMGASLVALLGGGYLVTLDLITTGTVVAFYAYLVRTLQPVRSATGLLYGWHRYKASKGRLEKWLEQAAPLTQPEQPTTLTARDASIQLDALSFAYQPDRKVLDQVELSLEPGAWVAVLGPSGAGKSTLGKLVPRLFDPTDGALRFDGVDAPSLSLPQLREQVGYVGQEVFLFEGSFRENITFGLKQEISPETLDWAVRAAGVDEIIADRPDGLDSKIGSGGKTLSGGQRKRVAMARALVHSPSVIVIDQLATDLEERLNQRIFDALRERYTGSILYLGHRLPAGFVPESVYWLEDGVLVSRPDLA